MAEKKETILFEVIPASKATKSLLVDSSNGYMKYTVATDGQNWSCTCEGYKYRGNCRHIQQSKGV